MSEQYEQSQGINEQNEYTEQGMDAVKARAVVVATEQAVRTAVERAREVTLRLERLGSGRHLAHELMLIEAEIDRAWQELHEAEQTLQRMQRQASPSISAEQSPTPDAPSEIPDTTDTADALVASSPVAQASTDSEPMSANEKPEERPGKPLVMEEPTQYTLSGVLMEPVQIGLPEHISREDVERIERIDEEEEMLAMSAAMTTADVAAAAAAEAEAFAEASSARVREVRRLAERADRILEQVNLAIQRGVLSGDAAQATHRDAERDANYAHTLLIEAENTESWARRAAADAEAEAEVAEGMAAASQGHFVHGDYRDAGNYALEKHYTSYRPEAVQPGASRDESDAKIEAPAESERNEKSDNDDDDTIQLPSFRLPSRPKQRPQDAPNRREQA